MKWRKFDCQNICNIIHIMKDDRPIIYFASQSTMELFLRDQGVGGLGGGGSIRLACNKLHSLLAIRESNFPDISLIRFYHPLKKIDRKQIERSPALAISTESNQPAVWPIQTQSTNISLQNFRKNWTRYLCAILCRILQNFAELWNISFWLSRFGRTILDTFLKICKILKLPSEDKEWVFLSRIHLENNLS